MKKRTPPCAAFGRLLLFAGLLLPGVAAGAATTVGQATAVISSGVALRSGSDQRLRIEASATMQIPAPRSVTRPCRPNDPEEAVQCRFLLVEMQ